MMDSRKMSESFSNHNEKELKVNTDDPTPDFGFSEIKMGEGSLPFVNPVFMTRAKNTQRELSSRRDNNLMTNTEQAFTSARLGSA